MAQVAALDLGWRGLSHWTHNHGSSRVFNPAAAAIYNSLYEGEASQRTVANQDAVPTLIPESDDYTFVLEGFHIYGTNTTYGMNVSFSRDDFPAIEVKGIPGSVADTSIFSSMISVNSVLLILIVLEAQIQPTMVSTVSYNTFRAFFSLLHGLHQF